MNDPETKPEVAPVVKGGLTRTHTKALVLGVATAMGLYLCYRLALPFLPALTWALALAILVSPLHGWVESRLKRANLAASLSVLLVALAVAVPATFLGQRILVESARGAEIIKTKVQSGEWRHAIEAQPRLAPLAGWLEQKIDLPGTVNTLTTWLTTMAGAVVKGSVVQLIGFLLVFYLLFYFLRDRRAALQALKWLSPLAPAEMDRLFSRVEDAVFATVYGTLAVSAVQGLLGGLMFWWLGLPAPLLWGMVMAVLAIVPVLGAFIIWVPAACFLALEGSWGKALILTVWGGVIVGGIDNLLLPYLVGSRLKLHTILAFLSVVGGLIVFGAAGLILGPVVLALTKGLLEIWRDHAEDPATGGT